jgi:EAL domain-containing protein (putative c-di-GMP-specific phosphodiesterase class I)
VTVQSEAIGGIRRALERHELVLHYQPKVDMRTGDIVGHGSGAAGSSSGAERHHPY